jgi:Bax protein
MNHLSLLHLACSLIFCVASLSTSACSKDIIVLASTDEAIGWLEAQDWWGEESRDEQLTVPHAMLVGINPAWRQAAQQLPVPEKKEIFFRFMLPLIVHANNMVIERRAGLIQMQAMLAAGKDIPEDGMEALRGAAVLLQITSLDEAAKLTQSSDELPAVIEEALYKLDIIPAGLVLGQAAYESGYGTSRFAVEGNALFGQWTYGARGSCRNNNALTWEIIV